MTKLKFSDKVCVAIATLFGVGYAPLFGGTLASVVAVFVFFVVKNQVHFFIFTIASVILAFLLAGRAEKIFGEKDCKKIVIDDFSGMLISLLFIPHTLQFGLCAFLLFRVFDAFKTPPINKIERLEGALGVVGDDLLAGLYALVALQTVRLFI